jgi:hypothetical protein
LDAFFAELAFLADLAFFAAPWAERAATRAFLAAFGCAPVAVAVAAPVSSVINVVILLSPFGGDYRDHDMDHSVAPERQANSERNPIRRWNGDAAGIVTQMTAGDRR